MLFLALAVAGCAGYFSILGLSQLFAGASVAVIIMASVLEVGKIVTTTALHRHWNNLAKGLRLYLTISVGILMLITSAGIYGFLSNAYQKTANKLEIHNGGVDVLNSKKILFEKNILDNEKIIVTKNKRIDQLASLRINQETRLDSAKTNKNKDKVRADINLATNEIQKLTTEIDLLNNKNTSLSDSVSKYNIKVLELNSSSDVAAEVGPLKYISELTGTPMGKVVNFLILLLIFVFDPLAVALILMTNKIFELQGDVNPIEVKKEFITQNLKRIISETDSQPEIVETENFNVTENVIQEEIIEEKVIEESIKPEIIEEVQIPLTESIEEDRGFSVPVPKAKKGRGTPTNAIQRIGSNKEIRDGNNDTFIFKRK
jgi:hypothetical protein